jgi:glycogen(starch) synthase
MRIAFISYEYPPDSCNGGIATYVGQAVEMLRDRGHVVEVFASSPSRHGTFNENGVLVHWIHETDRMDFGPVVGHVFAQRHKVCPFDVLEGPEYRADARKAFELAPDVARVVKMHTPSLLIERIDGPKSLRFRLRHYARQTRNLLRDLCKKKDLEDFAFEMPNVSRILPVDKWERNHCMNADIIAAPCLDLCRYAHEKWCVDQSHIRHVPYPYTPKPEYLKSEIKADGYVVGFVGRLERRKGIESLCEAIPQILAQHPSAKFRFIGGISHVPETGQPYDQFIKSKLGDAYRAVEIVGKVPLEQIAACYAGLDVAVFPSIWENFPNVCLEAMASGRSIVSTCSGGMAEMLDGGKVGVLVQPQDPKQLADAINALLSNPERRLELGAQARQRVQDAYNIEVIGKLTESVYEEARELARLRMNNQSTQISHP